ncbi:MAG: RNA 3'-terminal phosphate cyclase [Pseudomonadota bacterium]
MMIAIDGGLKSGSGTIVRDAVPFSILMGKDLHLRNIRLKRDKPGLRYQHLKAVQASAQISTSKVKGAEIGSKEIQFYPGRLIRGGHFNWNIGTAGSAIMLASSVIPLSLFADTPSICTIRGGLFQDFSPSAHHFKYILLPLLKTMGIHIEFEIIRPGYVPKGEGQISIIIHPLREKLKPLTLLKQGNLLEIRGIALSSHLEARKVSERMAKMSRRELKARGYDPKIEILYDTESAPSYKHPSIQAGASLAIWARSDTGCLMGSEMAGAPKRTAEYIGTQTVKNLFRDLDTGATVDIHTADQLIPFAALADGWSEYRVSQITDHIESRLWLVEEILHAKTEVKGHLLRIQGIGYNISDF